MNSMKGKQTGMFHDGHRELQDRFDRRMADALEKNLSNERFKDEDICFIEQAEFFFLATAHGESVDCSFKGGSPGFVRVTGPQSLQWQDYDGNSMYRSLGNILKSPQVGILFIQFGDKPKRLRLIGYCSLIDDDTQSQTNLIVEVKAREIFPNCPRYIPDLSTNKPSQYFLTRMALVLSQRGSLLIYLKTFYLKMIHIVIFPEEPALQRRSLTGQKPKYRAECGLSAFRFLLLSSLIDGSHPNGIYWECHTNNQEVCYARRTQGTN